MAETNVEDGLCAYVCSGVYSSIMAARESGGPYKLVRSLWVPESYCSAEFFHLHIFITPFLHLGKKSKFVTFFGESVVHCGII